MSIAEYIKPEYIVLDMKPQSRHDIFTRLSSCLLSTGVIDKSEEEILINKLEEREKQSTTGVGEGIAIPHASLESFPETSIVIGVVPEGVDFNSVDGKPVNVVFMIIGSQAVPRLHIQILAKIVRLSRNRQLMKKIEGGTSPEEVLDAIRSEES